ncbi:hypothetical protein [Streptomyces sp. NPDC059009]|uniref:hypothetical protein n=1 Tax=Streptomyces sp. NPDC059009 TaxID=3346694 RepID=UPI00367879B4
MARTDYTPPQDTSRLFARYKRIREQEAELRPEVHDMAVRELRGGATVGQLARLSGLTPEYFRRIAREEGIERLRPPTVRPLKDDTDADGA